MNGNGIETEAIVDEGSMKEIGVTGHLGGTETCSTRGLGGMAEIVIEVTANASATVIGENERGA